MDKQGAITIDKGIHILVGVKCGILIQKSEGRYHVGFWVGRLYYFDCINKFSNIRMWKNTIGSAGGK